MRGAVKRLQDLFEAESVAYETLLHPQDYTARRTAADTHSRPEDFAKTVFLWVDDRLVMAVLPADHTASPNRVRTSLAADSVRLANEEEAARRAEITFNAGSHDHAVRMAYADWARLASPRVVALSRDDE